jgi:hypothetical protein
MTTILAQMSGNTVAAGCDRKLGRAHRVGMTPAASISNGGDVIDIDAKTETVHALSLRMI